MGKYKGLYDGFSNGLEKALEILSAGIIGTTALMISAEVVTRYFFGKTYGLFEEGPRLFLCYAIFPMLGVVYKRRRHISVDTLAAKLRGRRRIFLGLVIDAAMIGGSIILLMAGLSGTESLYTTGMRVVGILDLPKYLLMLSIPIGAGLLLLFSLESGIKNLVALAVFDESLEQMDLLDTECKEPLF